MKHSPSVPSLSQVFQVLAASRMVHDYEDAFSQATGLPLKLLPNNPAPEPIPFGPCQNPFCARLGETPQGCALCAREHNFVQRQAAETHEPFQSSCFAGMTDVAVPVVVDGSHVATLFAGQVFLEKPTKARFSRVARRLITRGVKTDFVTLRDAYLHTRVISDMEFEAMLRLLRIFAGHLACHAGQCLLQQCESDPLNVALAKDFAQQHAAEPIAMPDAAHHVHLSACYFCKIFKKSTGITFTEYVSRIRVENAKGLLADSRKRVSEIAYDSGFDSIPNFNRVFKRYAGMAPTEYRASLREIPAARDSA